MKKFMLSISALALFAQVYADDFSYLTFLSKDGTKTSYSIENLNLVYEGDVIKITNDETTQELAISNLDKMYFDNVGEATAISVIAMNKCQTVEVYKLNGMLVGTFEYQNALKLPAGTYILKSELGTTKLTIK
jgi:hypothetical protein